MKRLLFSAQGRINRALFWRGTLVIVAITVGSAVFSAVFGHMVPHETSADGTVHVQGMAALPIIFVSGAAMILDIWAGICLAVKRYHDRDKSGWWMLIQLVPIIGVVWHFAQVGCLRGTLGPNRYGPDPLLIPTATTATSSAA